MISDEAYQDRKWGRYAELRKIFESLPVPASVYGWSSASDNLPARITRQIELVATIQENSALLAEATRSVADTHLALRELSEVRQELESTARLFVNLSEKVYEIMGGTEDKRLRSALKLSDHLQP
jgi:hypothetical protein